MSEIAHLFVYGTLRGDMASVRPPAAREAFALMAAGAELEGQASMSGQLFSVAWYPGLVADRAARVRGEVWRMRDPKALLAGLDAYEGGDYVRERRIAKLDDGRRLEAHVYRFTGDLSRARLIDSGDYLDWIASRETT